MTTNEMKKFLIDTYIARAYTHLYILGFFADGAVWRVVVTADQLDFVTKLDKASRGAGYSLRFKPKLRRTTSRALVLKSSAQRSSSES